MAYKVTVWKWFDLYNDWLLQWGFPEGKRLIGKNDFYIILGEDKILL